MPDSKARSDAYSMPWSGDFATPTLTLSTTNADGTSLGAMRADAQIALFDATVPTTIAWGAAAAAGSAAIAARRDHGHGMLASPLGGTQFSTTLTKTNSTAYSPISGSTSPTFNNGDIVEVFAIFGVNAGAGGFRINMVFGSTDPTVGGQYWHTATPGGNNSGITNSGGYSVLGTMVSGDREILNASAGNYFTVFIHGIYLWAATQQASFNGAQNSSNAASTVFNTVLTRWVKAN